MYHFALIFQTKMAFLQKLFVNLEPKNLELDEYFLKLINKNKNKKFTICTIFDELTIEKNVHFSQIFLSNFIEVLDEKLIQDDDETGKMRNYLEIN